MTPVEAVALHGCTFPKDGRACHICLDRAQRHVRAVTEAGMVVVPAEDLRAYLDRGTDLKREVEAMRRLRAALPERTGNA